MNEQDRMDDPIDRLVWRFLESEEATVDTDALMDGLRRRRARRRVVRLSVRLCAAAAVVLIVVGFLVYRGIPPARPGNAVVKPPAALLSLGSAVHEPLMGVLRREVSAALRGARSSGQAAVSAGAAPLVEVAQANRDLPDLVSRAGSAVDRFLESTNPRSDHTPKEDTQWRL